MQGSAAASGSGAVAGDELWTFLFLLGQGGIGLETAPAARFVRAGGANNNELFAFDEALGVDRGIATAHANGQELGDLFGDREQARHRFERTAAVISVQACDDHALPQIGELGANLN